MLEMLKPEDIAFRLTGKKKEIKLTFQDICPLWDEAITEGKANRKLSMHKWDKCIVGEARGFSMIKVCSCFQCIMIASNLSQITKGASKIKILDHNAFLKNLDLLTEHVEKKHRDER